MPSHSLLFLLSDISIHTPTKGATLLHAQFSDSSFNFNPHSHEGSDDNCHHDVLQYMISIHTPTKGATASKLAREPDYQFQSTLPRRERLLLPFAASSCIYFNPHSHEGSDSNDFFPVSTASKFQSTLPRRERRHP